jgi:hypothetical protein
MLQTDLFGSSIAPCGPRVPDNVWEMAQSGKAGSTLLDWDGDPALAIKRAIAGFVERGWTCEGSDVFRDGWLAWFRSQGELAPPIVTWRRDA